MNKFDDFLGNVAALSIIIVLMALLFGLPTMWLWNWLMPTLFGLVKIGFWQALGLNALTGILFRSSYSSK